ncbi:MAG: adaptor protein MecA [Lachnospiraceae bacterium]
MRFEKIDNETLKCTLSQEDLLQNGVELDDLFSNNHNAREFLEKIIRMAEMEVGFRTNGQMMSIQAAIMSENEIVLTFSENQVNSKEIIEHLKNMFSGTKGGTRKAADFDAKEEILKEVGKGVEKEKDKRNMKQHIDLENKTSENEIKTESVPVDFDYLLTFKTLSDVITFCKIIPSDEHASSILYFLDKEKLYYLQVNMSDSPKRFIYEFVAAAMEFSADLEKNSIRSSYLQEHAKIICQKDALKTLSMLS